MVTLQSQLPVTYQSHSSEDGYAVDALDREVDQAGYYDDEIEDVPAAGEVLLAQGHQLEGRLEREKRGENLREELRITLAFVEKSFIFLSYQNAHKSNNKQPG